MADVSSRSASPVLKRWVSLAECQRTPTVGRASQATGHFRDIRSQQSASTTYRKRGSKPRLFNAATRNVTPEQRSGLPAAIDRASLTRLENSVDRPQPTVLDHGWRDRPAPLVDNHRGTSGQADGGGRSE